MLCLTEGSSCHCNELGFPRAGTHPAPPGYNQMLPHLPPSSSPRPNIEARRHRTEEITIPIDGVRALRRVAYVIDDSEDARDLYGDALHEAGFRVVEARDGREAMDLLL